VQYYFAIFIFLSRCEGGLFGNHQTKAQLPE